jgi:hypothetical protein
MSRQEDFIQAGIDYRMEHGTPMAIGGGNFTELAREMNRARPFEAGCEHGYQYAVKKACEWLERNAYLYVDDIDQLHESALIGDFRKAMED